MRTRGYLEGRTMFFHVLVDLSFRKAWKVGDTTTTKSASKISANRDLFRFSGFFV